MAQALDACAKVGTIVTRRDDHRYRNIGGARTPAHGRARHRLRAEPDHQVLAQRGGREVPAHRVFMSLGRGCRVDDLFAVMGDQGAGDVPDTSPMSEVQQERAAGRGDRLGGKSVGYSGIAERSTATVSPNGFASSNVS